MRSLSTLSRFAALNAAASSSVRVLSSAGASRIAVRSPATSSLLRKPFPISHRFASTAATASAGTKAKKTKKPAAGAAAAAAKAKSTKPKKKTKAAAAAPKKKKAAAKKKAAPKKTEVKKPWEKRDENGNLVPLPKDTKPKLNPAWILFIKEKIREPGFNAGNKKSKDAIVELATVWRGMSDAEKKPYLDQGAAQKEKYFADLEQWKASLTAEDVERQKLYERHVARRTKALAAKKGIEAKPRRSLGLRDPLRPKRPLTAFFEFLGEYRAQHHDEIARSVEGEGGIRAHTVVSKKAAEAWNSADAATKHPYEERAKRHLEQYHIAVKAYENRKNA